jgi:hypothetical protein
LCCQFRPTSRMMHYNVADRRMLTIGKKYHSAPFASCHSEEEKRLKNLAQDKLREESKIDSSPVRLRMTNRVAK